MKCMKLISINIEFNKHTRTVLDFLKRETADVICIQELLEEEFNFYKKELSLEGVFQPFNYVCHHIDSKLTYDTTSELKGKRYGVAILTKNIIKSGCVFYEGEEKNILKPFDEYIFDEKLQNNKALIWVDTKIDDKVTFRFITTQLPVTLEGEVTNYQLAIINSMLSHLEELGEFVLCGDMNAPRGCKSFALIAEKYKDNIPLKYKTSIDQNLHRVKGIQFMVDGLFTTNAYKTSNVRLQDGISDHMAVIAEISKD